MRKAGSLHVCIWYDWLGHARTSLEPHAQVLLFPKTGRRHPAGDATGRRVAGAREPGRSRVAVSRRSQGRRQPFRGTAASRYLVASTIEVRRIGNRACRCPAHPTRIGGCACQPGRSTIGVGSRSRGIGHPGCGARDRARSQPRPMPIARPRCTRWARQQRRSKHGNGQFQSSLAMPRCAIRWRMRCSAWAGPPTHCASGTPCWPGIPRCTPRRSVAAMH